MKGLAWDNGEVGGSKVAAGGQYWFATECSQRIYCAVAGVQLSAMALALSEACKSGDRGLGLSGVKWNDFTAEFFDQIVQGRKRRCSNSGSQNDTSFEQRHRAEHSDAGLAHGV